MQAHVQAVENAATTASARADVASAASGSVSVECAVRVLEQGNFWTNPGKTGEVMNDPVGARRRDLEKIVEGRTIELTIRSLHWTSEWLVPGSIRTEAENIGELSGWGHLVKSSNILRSSLG